MSKITIEHVIAKKIIKYVRSCGGIPSHPTAFAKEILASLWTPVEDGLPEVKGIYRVKRGSGYEDHAWWEGENWRKNAMKIKDVTHYQPITEPA